MSFTLPGKRDKRTRVTFTLPIDVDGNDVYDDDANLIGEPATIWVRRFDYLDEPTYDAMMAALDELDVEAQMVAVAHDLAAVPPNNAVNWEPLVPEAAEKLHGLGVRINRVAVKVTRDELTLALPRDQITAPSKAVLDRLEPWSSKPVLPPRKRGREIALTMLAYTLPEKKLELCRKLTAGDLDELLAEWRKKSGITLGESEASASTSGSTGRPSSLTSSTADGDDGTSASD